MSETLRLVKLQGRTKEGRKRVSDYGSKWVLAEDVARGVTWMQQIKYNETRGVIFEFNEDDYHIKVLEL